jgi:hypothetical protein
MVLFRPESVEIGILLILWDDLSHFAVRDPRNGGSLPTICSSATTPGASPANCDALQPNG